MDSLRDVRKSRGWTLAELGGLAGVDAATISRIERRRAKPRPETIVRIARALGLTVDRVRGMVVTDDELEGVS